MVAKEDILAKWDFRPGTQARDDKSSPWRSHVAFNKHPAQWHIKQAPSAIWQQLHDSEPCETIQLQDLWLSIQTSVVYATFLHLSTGIPPSAHRTHLTCAHNTLLSTFLPKWFPICPTFPYFVIAAKLFQVKCCCALGLGCVHLWKHTQDARSTFQAK